MANYPLGCTHFARGHNSFQILDLRADWTVVRPHQRGASGVKLLSSTFLNSTLQ